MKEFLIFLILVIVGGAGIFFLVKPDTGPKTPAPTTAPSPKPVDFTASFEIYTNGTKRVFTDKKYHNLSTDVYITLPDPSVVNVKKDGIAWSDFFSTLPMKLAKDCLTTGTGQVFCTDEAKKLKFSINGIEDPAVLDKEIKPGDKLLVTY